MSLSLRALLHGIIDYAGLFPPASLPLDETVLAYSRHRRGPHSWALGRLVVPALRLPELYAVAVPELTPAYKELPIMQKIDIVDFTVAHEFALRVLPACKLLDER